MNFSQITKWILKHKLYVVIGGVALILVLYFASGSIGGMLDRWHASKFDKKQQAYEKQITDLRVERDAATKRGDEAEAKALLKETEAAELRDLVAAKGGQIEKSAKELEAKIEDAKRNAGVCATDPDPRGCTCAKLRAVGFECN